MALEARLEVYGVREAFRELDKIDKKQKFKAINRVKAAGAPLLQKARDSYPLDRPLSGWEPDGRLGYSPAKVKAGVQLQVGGRAQGNAYPIATIVQKNAGGALFDIAGFNDGNSGEGGKRGDQFIAVLNYRYGKAQRGMWRNIRFIREIGFKAIEQALKDVVEETNKKLVVVDRKVA